MNELGKLIAKHRKLMRMRQSDLGAWAQVSGSYIAHIEAGRRKPSLFLLNRIAVLLEIEDEVAVIQHWREHGR